MHRGSRSASQIGLAGLFGPYQKRANTIIETKSTTSKPASSRLTT